MMAFKAKIVIVILKVASKVSLLRIMMAFVRVFRLLIVFVLILYFVLL